MNHENQLQAYLTLDPARNRIRIHRQTIRLLKNPAYVQFLVNPEELYIAVLGSDKPISGGTANKVRMSSTSQQSIEFYSTILIKNLIRPLRREEYRQLELNLVVEGCREDIIAWNDTIIDGHNRYEICNKMRIPYGVKELDFPSRDAAIAWICANQLGRRNISEETRKYLIGKQYEVEKKVQRNRNGYNQYRPNPNIAVGRGRPIDEESGRRTAARLGRKYHVSGATVQKYAKYSAALDTIEQNAPELVPHILSGAYKISFENIVALSEMEPEELRALSKKIGKNPYAFARYSESRRCLYSDASAKPGTAAAEQPAIKTMPAYDPDAEVAGLTLTIPSWMSSIDRTKSMAHLEAISPAARQNLLAALTELEGKIQEMLNAIEVES